MPAFAHAVILYVWYHFTEPLVVVLWLAQVFYDLGCGFLSPNHPARLGIGTAPRCLRYRCPRLTFIATAAAPYVVTAAIGQHRGVPSLGSSVSIWSKQAATTL